MYLQAQILIHKDYTILDQFCILTIDKSAYFVACVEQIMMEAIPNDRANRGHRAKFPEDVLLDSLPGQLWFGAEVRAWTKSQTDNKLIMKIIF